MSDTKLPTTLDEMLSISNVRASYHNQLQMAKLKFEAACIMSYDGSQFEINPYILGFLQHNVQVNSEQMIMLSVNNLPKIIDDLENFLERANSLYHCAINEYFDEVTRIQSCSRDPAQIMEAELSV